jgi:hypothetical protein
MLMSIISLAFAGAAEMAFALHAPLIGALLAISASASTLLTLWMLCDLIRPVSSR